MNKFVSHFLRKFLSSPRKEWLRVESVFMVAGIIISVAVLTVSLAIFDGYIKAMKQAYFGVNSHLYFFNREDDNLTRELQTKLNEFLKNQSEVDTFAPVITNQVMLSAQDRIKGSMLRGIDSEVSPQPTSFRKYVVQGDAEIAASDKIVLGYKLARQLNVAIGDTIKVISPLNSSVTAFGLMPREKEFVLSGLYRSGMHDYDAKYAFCDLERAADFFGLQQKVTMYEVKLLPAFIEQADYYAYKWRYETDLEFQTSSWIDFSGNLFALLALEKWVIFIILSFLVLIASFNVISSVSSTILEKKRELGIMKAFGTSNHILRQILLGRTLIISFLAICLGQLLGYLLALFISHQNLLQMKGEIYFIDQINVAFNPLSWLLILTISLLIVFFASLVPLRRIEKLPVTDILRGSGK
ncbi:MAG: FtsX-like permease family protein [Candidatus Cloacimonadales bacterium]